jgi:hypothetical protein
MNALHHIKIASLVLLGTLFTFSILFENVFHVYSMPITGWQRPIWFLLFVTGSLFLVAMPFATAVRQRHISILDYACLASVLLAWLIYPLGVRVYCFYASRSRADTWHWVYEGGGLYYFVDRRHPDVFAGQIEVYPPYFSLPKP